MINAIVTLSGYLVETDVADTVSKLLQLNSVSTVPAFAVREVVKAITLTPDLLAPVLYALDQTSPFLDQDLGQERYRSLVRSCNVALWQQMGEVRTRLSGKPIVLRTYVESAADFSMSNTKIAAVSMLVSAIWSVQESRPSRLSLVGESFPLTLSPQDLLEFVSREMGTLASCIAYSPSPLGSLDDLKQLQSAASRILRAIAIDYSLQKEVVVNLQIPTLVSHTQTSQLDTLVRDVQDFSGSRYMDPAVPFLVGRVLRVASSLRRISDYTDVLVRLLETTKRVCLGAAPLDLLAGPLQQPILRKLSGALDKEFQAGEEGDKTKLLDEKEEVTE